MLFIPLIDIESLFGTLSPARDRTDADLVDAAANTGFLTIKGIPGDVLSEVNRRQLLSLFSMPQEVKQTRYKPSFDPILQAVYRGWFPVQDGYPTYKEGIDMGPDLANGLSRTAPGDPLTEPTPLPAEHLLPGWRAMAKNYYLTMESVGAALLQSLARGMGIEETCFSDPFVNGISTLRMIHYPLRPKQSYGTNTNDFRVKLEGQPYYMLGAPHTDSGCLTLLAQDGVEGLQAQSQDGSWLTVPALDETLAINFGKLLQRWTGGRVRATHHRVLGSGRMFGDN